MTTKVVAIFLVLCGLAQAETKKQATKQVALASDAADSYINVIPSPEQSPSAATPTTAAPKVKVIDSTPLIDINAPDQKAVVGATAATLAPSPDAPKPEVMKVDKRRNRVSVSDDNTRTWIRRDTVCLERHGRTLACGRVLAVGIKGAIVQLSRHTADIKPGDLAKYIRPDQNIPQITDESLTAEGILEVKPYTYNIALGYNISLDLFYPEVHFYWAVSPTIAIGFQAAYISKSDDATLGAIKGEGGALTLNYFSQDYFRGLWLHLASGFYHLNATDPKNSQSINAPLVTGLIGWREDWAHGLNVAAGFGARFLSPLSGIVTGISYHSMYPFGLVEVGVSF